MIKYIFIISLLFCTISPSYGACRENCNDRGVCVDGKFCDCFLGYGSGNDTDPNETCRSNLTDDYSAAWDAIRSILAFLWGFCGIIAAVGLYVHPPTHLSDSETDGRTLVYIKTMILICIVIMCILQVLTWSIDPRGFYFLIPVVVSNVLENLFIPLAALCFIGILFHWIELYTVASNSLKKAEMLAKINSKYTKQVTVEEIVARVSLVRKLRTPFVVVAILGFLVDIIRHVFRASTVASMLTWLRALYFTIFWAVSSIGFIVYGRRLASLMPQEVASKILKATKKISVVGITVFVAWVVSSIVFILFLGSHESYLVALFISNLIILIIPYGLLSVFIEPHTKFPFFFQFSREESEGTTKDASSTLTAEDGSNRVGDST